VENASHARHTLELSMMVRLVHQIYALKEKRYCQTEHVKLAHNILELQVTIKDVPHKYVLLDRSSKSMEDVPNATHIPELMPQERSVSHTTAMTDKNLVQMDLVLTAQTLRELKELDLLVDQTHAILDKESREMELASTVSCSMLFAATEDAAQSQLASQWSNISQWMVFANHVSSMNKLHQTVLSVRLIQPRSCQTLKLWLHHQFLSSQLLRLMLAKLVMMYGLMSNSCQRTVPLDFTLTSRLETGASFWAVVLDFLQHLLV